MLKRLLPIVLIVLLAIPAGFFLFHKKNQETAARQSPALTVVPDDAVWIIESRSVPDLLKTLVQSEPLFPSLQQLGIIQPHLLALRKIDSLITRNSRFRELYTHSPAVLSLHQTGKSQYQFLIILETEGTAGEAGAADLFTGLCGSPGQWTRRIYNGQKINRITFGVDALVPGISLAGNNKFLIISPSPILLENAARQMNLETGLHSSKAFHQLSQTTGENALANIYVNLKAFPGWLSRWMNPALKRKLEMYTHYGDWASLDLTIRNDAVWLNGFALEGDTLNSYLNLFRNQEPRKLQADQYLPSSTAVYFTLGVDKPAQYLKGLADYLGGGESGRKRQRIIDKAVEATKENVVEVWSNLGFKELTIGYLCGVADDSYRPVALIEVKNSSQAAAKLIIPPKTEAEGKSGRKPVPVTVFTLDNQREYPVYSPSFSGLPEILGGNFFSAVAGTHFTFIGNVLVMADDIQTIGEVLHKYSLNKTLAHDAVYLSLARLVSTRSNVTFFAIPYKARPLLQHILNAQTMSGLFANDQFLMKTGAIGLQFNASNGMLLHNFFASFAEIDYSKPQTLWESKLDARVISQPVIVTNHITRDKEILVQDEAANLYLLNSSGRILWKKNIGESINSEIFQVDVMKNGRLQYLFSTGQAIHLIDRNGAYLPKYPVKLNLAATNGMALVDFDGTRDYRILIACSDNKVYGFDKNGNPLKGWKFGPASGKITRPVQHFKIQNKDYLVLNDPVKVYVLDRKGLIKMIPEKDFAISANNMVIYEALASDQGPRFLITDITGTVFSLLLDGSVESKKFGEFSPDHYFIAEDVNRDGLSEFVFIDRNKLEIFSRSGEKLISRKFDGTVSGPPGSYLMAGKMRKIGLTVASRNEILLYDSDGSLHKGFPLYGQSPFIIGNLEKASAYQNLLVGSDEAYLYNYAIQ